MVTVGNYILIFSFVAKLHQHIVAQQVSEATAVRKLESAQAKVRT